MSIQNDAQTKILSRVRALVERGERVPQSDIAALFTVTDTNALARIARIPRERRFGRTAFYTDVLRVEVRGGSVEELVATIDGSTASVALVPTGEPTDAATLPALARELATRRDVTILTDAAGIDHVSRELGVPHAPILTQLRSVVPTVVSLDGAELFDAEIRERWAPRTIPAEHWLAVHRAAHLMQVRTIAGMTYLTVERPKAYAAHLEEIRALQDQTGGFAAFVPVPVHNRDRDASYLAVPSAHQSLRAVAIARIALDNIEHIGVAPALIGPEVAYVAMSYGADTIDTTIVAGAVQLVESDGPVSLDLPILDSPTKGAPDTQSALIESRLVESRFLPVALNAAYEPRAVAETAP